MAMEEYAVIQKLRNEPPEEDKMLKKDIDKGLGAPEDSKLRRRDELLRAVDVCCPIAPISKMWMADKLYAVGSGAHRPKSLPHKLPSASRPNTPFARARFSHRRHVSDLCHQKSPGQSIPAQCK